jgi:hypothetical protein
LAAPGKGVSSGKALRRSKSSSRRARNLGHGRRPRNAPPYGGGPGDGGDHVHGPRGLELLDAFGAGADEATEPQARDPKKLVKERAT